MMSTRRSLFCTGVLVAALAVFGSAQAWAQATNSYASISYDVLDHDRVNVRFTTASSGGGDAVEPAKIEIGFKKAKEGTTPLGLSAPDMTFTIAFSSHGAASKEATGLAAGTTYLVALRGIDKDGKAQAWHYRTTGGSGAVAVGGDNPVPNADNSFVTTTAAPAPGRVDHRDIMVTAGDGMLMLEWKSPSAGTGLDIKDYTVAFSTEKHAEADVGSKAMMWPFTSAEPEATISGLTNDKIHYVWIKAVNTAGGVSEKWSEPVSGTPSATAVPALPLFGAFALGAGLLAAGRARLRNRRALHAGRVRRKLTR